MARPIYFGKYKLLGRIAQGGMAEIILARQKGLSGFEKFATVKRILPQYSKDEEFVRMFIDEAKIAAQLSHANIVHIYDLGKEGDYYFIAMEYIAGQDLWSILRSARRRNKPFKIPYTLDVITQVCKGLFHAHNFVDAQGQKLSVVHRDISPNNILATYDGQVKIVDFGIAKAAGRIVETKSGIIKGKFAYLSPEAALGEQIDHRHDIFATGICLWEAVCGRRLFDAEDDLVTLKRVQQCKIPSFASLNVSA
ncbi:MAG: serine/threonine-protein kinase, partial [Pseudomonadota bacterium]